MIATQQDRKDMARVMVFVAMAAVGTLALLLMSGCVSLRIGGR